MILVDTNVFVDVIHQDPIWLNWSLAELSKAKSKHQLITNFVVYAELHTHNTAGPHIDAFLHKLGVDIQDLTRPAAQLAANAFRTYRQRGGTKTGVLPVPSPGRESALSVRPMSASVRALAAGTAS